MNTLKNRRIGAALLSLLLALMLLVTGCSSSLEGGTFEETVTSPAAVQETAPEPEEPKPVGGGTAKDPAPAPSLNGWALSEFTLVVAKDDNGYATRAAEYIRDQILARTGVELPLQTDDKAQAKHEIVVGETNRAISALIDSESDAFRFSYLADGGHIAMEGEQFVIAAAAYRFVEDYITATAAATTVPTEPTEAEPITAPPKHFFLMIGDGMGVNHPKLVEANKDKIAPDFGDGEDRFYGYLFPYQGQAITNNAVNGTTDSAASATALATGVKTTNGRIGRDANDVDVVSVTELAAARGMTTAVVSTEVLTGATPSGFSAHASDRSETEAIAASQAALQAKYGTLLHGDYNLYSDAELEGLRTTLASVFQSLYANETGSFMMYEEAYIDKHSHSNKLQETYETVLRFNMAIGLVMEEAFYHPDTLVLITADHETGGLVNRGQGKFAFTDDGHTNAKVPVFAYGQGAQVFHDQAVENVQIPKTFAALWGDSLAPETNDKYPPLS